MPRNVSPDFVKEMFAQQTEVVLLTLLTIDHAALSTPVRLVANTEAITHQGEEFIAFPFTIILPTEGEGANGTAQLTIDNVDRSLMDELRSISDPLDIEIVIVMDQSPDTIEEGPIPFELRDVQWNATQITGTLYFDGNSTEPFPWPKANPITHPSLYA